VASLRRGLDALPAVALIATLFAVAPPPAAAVSAGTFYVDGKNGSDSHSGTSIGSAFKTIAKAALSLPAGSAAGWTINVVGYTDYVYRERPVPPGWDRFGSSGAPIVFQASGYNGSSSGYVRPIVSGADAAPAAGKTWTSSGTSGVWKTPWATAPFGYPSSSGSIKTAVFQDQTTWLWEQTSLSALATRAANGLGGYWWDAAGKELYISTVPAANPGGHSIDVVMRNAFYFDGRYPVSNVAVRGFEVRHSANGIAFAKGVDNGEASDNRLIGNLFMGVAVSGEQTGSGPDPASGALIQRNEAAFNTLQAIKLDEGTQGATICDNNLHDNGLQGVKVQGPVAGSSYTGTTSGNLICRNDLHDQNFNPTGSPYNNASGITVANGARLTTVSDNRIWANDVGVHITQESAGMPAVQDTLVERNEVWDNRRFGLYLFDGYNGSGAGRLTSSRDLYWDNGIGVMVDRGTSNKTVDHDTIWWNRGEGIKIGGFQVAPSSIVITQSLVTQNRSYGVWLVTGNSAAIDHTGLYANTGGDLLGAATTTAVNHQPPGYLSTLTSDPGFLTVASTSYQYTAGTSSTPVGARWADGFIDIATSIFRDDIIWISDQGITSGCSTDRYCPDASVSRGQMAAFLSRALNLPASSVDAFDDDNGSLFEADINRVAAAGIATGCGDRLYCPDASVTREQMASFLARALSLPPSGTDYFTDDNTSIHEGAINSIRAAGITSGCTATLYCPKGVVSRGQMAAFLHRAFG
jgi:parallel beta helix pectate lyase-like protein/S-layer family protein